MRWSAGGPCRVARYAVAVFLLLTASYRLAFEASSREQRLKSAESSSRRRGQGQDRLLCSGALSALSIPCLADSPPPAEWARPASALAALKSAPHHVVLAGHSRLRQVFEQLTPLLQAPLRTRADQPPPLTDREPASAPSLPANSTCLAAFPKPRAGHWCSLAADWGRLLLDFRWRSQTEPLSALLDRLSAQPPRLLLLSHGLYQALDAAGGLLQLRGRLPQLVTRLQQLQRRGTTAVWLLEAGMNPETRLRIPARNRDVSVTNALLTEVLLEAGVVVWSANLPLVSGWMTGDCRNPQVASQASRSTCEQELLHTDPDTNLRMAQQLVKALTLDG